MATEPDHAGAGSPIKGRPASRLGGLLMRRWCHPGCFTRSIAQGRETATPDDSESEKFPQPREFCDDLFRQDGTHYQGLWRSMNLVKVPYGGRLGHELPNALVEGAVDEQIGTGNFSATFVVERRPFVKNSRRIEVNVRVATGHRARALPPVLLLRAPRAALGRDFSALEVAGAMAKGEGRRRPALACLVLVSNLSNLPSFPSARESALDRAQRPRFGEMRAR